MLARRLTCADVAFGTHNALREYERHYNQHRTHRSLAAAAPLRDRPQPLDLTRSNTSQYSDGTVSAESSTSTGMPLDLCGGNFGTRSSRWGNERPRESPQRDVREAVDLVLPPGFPPPPGVSPAPGGTPPLQPGDWTFASPESGGQCLLGEALLDNEFRRQVLVLPADGFAPVGWRRTALVPVMKP